ncbi:MAG: hypothetical protein KDA25_13560 [Phycisphaerales bacterium]|nr:hypothetical protein [Phycisphaerales bacterium]
MSGIARGSGGRRGAVLFEVVLSIALFIAAAAFTLSTARSVLTSLDASHRRLLACDLARSRMAELELGIIGLADLRDQDGFGAAAVGSIDVGAMVTTDRDPQSVRWRFDVRTERSEHPGLSVVILTVSEDTDVSDPDASTGASYTLRELIALREDDPEAYEQDALLEGLPTEPEPDPEAPR